MEAAGVVVAAVLETFPETGRAAGLMLRIDGASQFVAHRLQKGMRSGGVRSKRASSASRVEWDDRVDELEVRGGLHLAKGTHDLIGEEIPGGGKRLRLQQEEASLLPEMPDIQGKRRAVEDGGNRSVREMNKTERTPSQTLLPLTPSVQFLEIEVRFKSRMNSDSGVGLVSP
jgi:hypothetical protein